MRFLLFFLISFPVYAQIDTGTGINGSCDEIMIAAGGTFNCTDLLVDVSPVFVPGTPALIIKVQGNAIISAPINLNGGNGTNDALSPAPGGDGGPGAGSGGGFGAGDTPQSASDSPLPSAGSAAPSSAVCGGGGGGGGFAVVIADGVACLGGGAGGLAGSVVTATDFSFGGIFRGGFGGGAGADGDDTPAPSPKIGTGGGAGGALQITAGGNITITANISAVGGSGGANVSHGGGGGGGSGGVIWIQATGDIINSAAINADGGAGGVSGLGGNGGPGSRGFIRLEDADGLVGGTLPGYETLLSTGTGPVSSTSNLESGISCGMIKPKDDQMLFQVMLGFALIAMLKILSQVLPKFLKMFVRLH